jgi:glutathione peroxidase
MTTAYDFTAKTLAGQDKALSDFRGQALLIVNVASRCGFTPQYEGLEELQEAYEQKGFSVLGFPCNQFGHQEPGDEAEIEHFCTLNYEVTFPMFAKIEVNGSRAHPLYAFLKTARRGVLGTAWIKWNFTKFLTDRDGRPIARYAPTVEPEAIAPDIEKALG